LGAQITFAEDVLAGAKVYRHRAGAPAARAARGLEDGIAHRDLVLSSTEGQPAAAGSAGFQAGRQPPGESQVGRPVPRVETPGQRPREAGDALFDQRAPSPVVTARRLGRVEM